MLSEVSEVYKIKSKLLGNPRRVESLSLSHGDTVQLSKAVKDGEAGTLDRGATYVG